MIAVETPVSPRLPDAAVDSICFVVRSGDGVLRAGGPEAAAPLWALLSACGWDSAVRLAAAPLESGTHLELPFGAGFAIADDHVRVWCGLRACVCSRRAFQRLISRFLLKTRAAAWLHRQDVLDAPWWTGYERVCESLGAAS